MFEHIILMQEQSDLLRQLVEPARNVPLDQRTPFLYVKVLVGPDLLLHLGLPGHELPAYEGDLDTLRDARLLRVTYGPEGSKSYDVTPLGYKYYEYLQQKSGQPIEQIEASIERFLDSEGFRRRHPIAFQKWHSAAERLWSSDSQAEWTTIGHLCREAVQEFADDLVHQFQPPDVPADKAKTIARMKGILNTRKRQLGATEAPFLDAFLGYWGTVSDLIQR